ncbi:hypothetical protein K4L44_13940 [Halosquirtibacter laminarini]|uniref:Uncharacterized protein n=1 Tax=Halosquirtibacter laminarini TaxID=3374600 RepID=A0AC61NMX1_9BACT|nr:hypothetical protein K4L44_13940 [Prolixibacteraceae bacterium]
MQSIFSYRGCLLMLFYCLCIDPIYSQYVVIHTASNQCKNCGDNEDFDHDGVPNGVDLDDDNDGILDEYESFQEIKTFYNGDFEMYPVNEFHDKYSSNGVYSGFITIGRGDGGYGWQTTDPTGRVEIWQSGCWGTYAKSGKQYIELNSDNPSRLFQVFAVKPGELIYYKVSHRARRFPDWASPDDPDVTKPTDVDVMSIYIFPDNPLQPNREKIPPVEPIQEVASTYVNWHTVTGHYRVPAGVTHVQLGFMAKSTSSEYMSVGNFLQVLT